MLRRTMSYSLAVEANVLCMLTVYPNFNTVYACFCLLIVVCRCLCMYTHT